MSPACTQHSKARSSSASRSGRLKSPYETDEFGHAAAGEGDRPDQRVALLAPGFVDGRAVGGRPTARQKLSVRIVGAGGSRAAGRVGAQRVVEAECRGDQAVDGHQMPDDAGDGGPCARSAARPRTSAAVPARATRPRRCPAAGRPAWRSPRRRGPPSRAPGYGRGGGPGSSPAPGSGAVGRGRGCRSVCSSPTASRSRRASSAHGAHSVRWSSTAVVSSAEHADSAQAPSSDLSTLWDSGGGAGGTSPAPAPGPGAGRLGPYGGRTRRLHRAVPGIPRVPRVDSGRRSGRGLGRRGRRSGRRRHRIERGGGSRSSPAARGPGMRGKPVGSVPSSPSSPSRPPPNGPVTAPARFPAARGLPMPVCGRWRAAGGPGAAGGGPRPR